MKMKSLIVLLLAGIWGVGSWWWYTCKVKGFCGADHVASQTVTDANSSNANEEQAKAAAEAQAKADADKAAAEAQAKADADKAAAEAQAKADADKAAAEAQAKADADKAAVDEQDKADADKAAAEAQAKADADKAAADEQDKADAGKITMETNAAAPDTGTGIDPALLHFPTGSANPQLADETKTYFEKVAKFLNDNASGTVSIVGHTDNQGKANKNNALGQQRANAIKQMLVRMGAPADRISTASEGQDKPIADNKTEEGRKKNRRVEITPAK